jgi:L-rhamnose isomerase
MSPVQNNGGTTGGITGRGFMPGRSGNPGGRPQSLAKATRALVGEDGLALPQIWWDIARDETRRDRDRLEASRLLADRGWGKAASFEPVEGDPLDLGDVEKAAEEFRRKVMRLAESQNPDSDGA